MFKVPPSVACWLEEIPFQYERSWQEAGQLKSFEEWGAAFLITPKVVVQMFHFVTHLSLCQKQEQTKGCTQCALVFTLKMNKDYATKQTEQLTSGSFMSREPARVCTFTETTSRGYGWLAVRSPPPAPTHLIAVATDQFELWLLLTKKKKWPEWIFRVAPTPQNVKDSASITVEQVYTPGHLRRAPADSRRQLEEL